MTWNVLIPEKLDDNAIQLLSSDLNFKAIILEKVSNEKLLEALATADALIVRSKTQVTKELLDAGKKLQVVGRAGVGTDNIDVVHAEKKGILVVNAPEESLDSVADLTMGLILTVCRKLQVAYERTKKGDFQRGDLLGCELKGLLLGIVGYGRIGQRVAQRAKAFGIKICAYDPFLNPKVAESEGVQLLPLQEVLKSSDVISLHLPLNDKTHNIISTQEFAAMKKGAYFINTSRAEIVDTKALIAALDAGKFAGVALDVVEEENTNNPLLKYPNVVISPHIGASTQGAQKNVGLIIVQEVMNVLKGNPARYPVNFPKIPSEAKEVYALFRNLISKMATVIVPLTKSSFNKMTFNYPVNLPSPVPSILTRTFLAILLKSITSSTEINVINAQKIAEERGIQIVESALSDKDFQNRVAITIEMNGSVLNTVQGQITAEQKLVLTKLNDYEIKFELSGHLFMVDFIDRPGMIGAICSFLGQNNINIAELQVARIIKTKTQLMALKTDQDASREVIAQLQKLKGVNWVNYYAL
jgi:D-3-phosphoglycerate dehydrogenase